MGQFVIVFGNSYYTVEGVMPEFAMLRINAYTNRYGNNLDTGAPRAVQHKANFIMKKWGSI